MFPNLKKVFWSDVSVTEADHGFGISLDQRALKTPEKHAFAVPARGLAEAVAAEWRAQKGDIDPAAMPFTGLSNAAIDKMPGQMGAVIDILAAYGETDLLCHRATGPASLIETQSAAWDPFLGWIKDRHGMAFTVTAGVMPVAQPDESLAALRDWVAQHDNFAMMALHDLVMISGSIIVAFAVTHKHVGAAEAWPVTRIDEDWQAAQWGADAEAEKAAAIKRADFLRAAEFYDFVTA